ncbi:hypothetical protein HAX54_036248 [Datura stramonium]|uniref:Uncharacterized protein n=1 Tax=Datura stramonium TaxID=4076 RepID=A0ABS8SGY1_DATST|nr:hypothetical protein [Datura stramonium]
MPASLRVNILRTQTYAEGCGKKKKRGETTGVVGLAVVIFVGVNGGFRPTGWELVWFGACSAARLVVFRQLEMVVLIGQSGEDGGGWSGDGNEGLRLVGGEG